MSRYVFVNKFKQVYSELVAIELLAVVGPLCFTALKATSSTVNDSTFIVWLEYFLICLSQLFILCLCGNEVTTQLISVQHAVSEIFGVATSEIMWKLRFMILHSNVELKLTGGRLFVLSMETFKKITGMALSNFIVLRQLKESKIV